MKVTVCFGPIRVVVPCGTGELLVRDLIREASRRYKKAASKDPDSWVVVHSLQSQSGILDPDDRVSDVADDREQILASFEDCSGPDPGVPQGGGDGASGSSVGTGSPDIFRGPTDSKFINEIPHIEVTGSNEEQLQSGLGLQVRRGSEPNLHQLDDQRIPSYNSSNQSSDVTKRWSAAPVCRNDPEPPERLLAAMANTGGGYLSTSWVVPESDHEESQTEISNNFSRSGRLSMQFLGDGAGYKWMEAADRVNNPPTMQYSSKSLPRELKRKEPLGQAYESMREKDCEMLLIINEPKGPLGLRAIPDIENGGLLVQSVESGSRAENGRLRRGDRILEINGKKLIGLSENAVSDSLRISLASPELRVKVMRASKLRKDENGVGQTKISPSRKANGNSLQVANTRRLGRRIEIDLKKGKQGLGFTVTTRDNPAGGDCPIYIKNIIQNRAAIEDGRLKPGDRLLEVDGIQMTGKTQAEVVDILKATKTDATVVIVVSRQEELYEVDEREIGFTEHDHPQQQIQQPMQQVNSPPKPPPPVLPKPTKNQNEPIKHTSSITFNGTNNESFSSNEMSILGKRETLTLHIPVYDSEKAGLGVSVKGKTGQNDQDLGIFIKSVMYGGAASRDGRLKMNDQLLSVNGISLLNQTNTNAMENLRSAMLLPYGRYPGMISLSVSRRISRSNSSNETLDTDNSNSEHSGSTVIYLSPEHKREGSDPSSAIYKKRNNSHHHETNKRWSNPVLDRLTGGTGAVNNQNRPPPLASHALRNNSYYIATNDTWSPTINMNESINGTINNSVLIEEDPEPSSPISLFRTIDSSNSQQQTVTTPMDITYASQLSLETNPPVDAFSRDAIGRRSISEKHHAALDAKETGTYQRNKKLREEKEKERSGMISANSEESLTDTARSNLLRSEARDQVGDLGPSLGLKKSSSLESLQTMVQELQMNDEPRGPIALRAPRGRGREESLRAAVERPSESQAKKHWLLEDNQHDAEGGFTTRNGPFLSSLNDGKNKNRTKKPSLLKGIGHMFRFGKHRKDGIHPTETLSDFGGVKNIDPNKTKTYSQAAMQQQSQSQENMLSNNPNEFRHPSGPPNYQPPPPVNGVGINKNDIFNHRYSHYVNYEELQQQISSATSSDRLSESTLDQMRAQVRHQRNKVEEESRRHQHYHSQRSTRNDTVHQQRPVSSYYEYETVQQSSQRKSSMPSASAGGGPIGQWTNTSGRNRGPFVTQVTIREQNHHGKQPSASQV